jgi:hypothetical protein
MVKDACNPLQGFRLPEPDGLFLGYVLRSQTVRIYITKKGQEYLDSLVFRFSYY